MTPEAFIEKVDTLVVAHRDREALDLVSRLLPMMAPSMNSEQITRVADLMHGAEMAVDLEESAMLREQSGPGSRVTRSA